MEENFFGSAVVFMIPFQGGISDGQSLGSAHRSLFKVYAPLMTLLISVLLWGLNIIISQLEFTGEVFLG